MVAHPVLYLPEVPALMMRGELSAKAHRGRFTRQNKKGRRVYKAHHVDTNELNAVVDMHTSEIIWAVNALQCEVKLLAIDIKPRTCVPYSVE
jgi:hypothetical protein